MNARHHRETSANRHNGQHPAVRFLLFSALMLLSTPGFLNGATAQAPGQGATPAAEAPAQPEGEAVATAMFAGGPAHTGEQPGPAPVVAPGVLWSFATGDEYVGATSAAVSPDLGLAFTSSNAVYAIDLATGQQVWSHVADMGFVSPLALVDGVLYAAGEDGAVYAFEPTTGTVIWRSQVEDGIPVDGGPLVIGDRLIVTTWMGNVHALDTSTGAIVWTTPIGGISFGQPAASGGLVVIPASTTGEMAFSGVLALDAASGSLAWTF